MRLRKKCTTFVRYKKLYDGYNNDIANDHGGIYSMMDANDHGETNAVTILRCVQPCRDDGRCYSAMIDSKDVAVSFEIEVRRVDGLKIEVCRKN